MSVLPALDLHAHVDVAIDQRSLDDLQAVVFAVTRSLAEAEQALQRKDRTTVWGVGCHPGVAAAHRAFSREQFRNLLDRTAFAGELGLDGKARVPLDQQTRTLRNALEDLVEKPRIVSLHSYAACEELLREIELTSVKGVILHWWLGNEELTQRAVSLGCWFSVNAAQASKSETLRRIPPERVLTETDHPFGDRRSTLPRRPGRVEDIEAALSRLYGIDTGQVRRQVWLNLGGLVKDVGCSAFLPRTVRARLAAIR
jgi:TatD DNase family protein